MSAMSNGTSEPETKQDSSTEEVPSLGYKTGPDGLSVQNLSKMDISTLSPLTGEVMSRQATINIGTIGHVFPDDIRELLVAAAESLLELGVTL